MKSDYYFHRKNTKQYRRVYMCIYPAKYLIIFWMSGTR